jgi:glycosyltransferase involved in cell wall biosynthesis
VLTSAISVIIPAYNEESDIAACLDALLGLDEPVHEVLVIDNNSTDGTAAIAESYARQSPTVRLITERQQGALHAAARGVREATGDLIAKIDADTVVSPQWTAAIRRFFDAVPPDVAGGSGLCSMHDMPAQWLFRSAQARFTAKLQAGMREGSITEMADTFGANCVMRASVWADIAPHTSTRDDIQDDLDIGITVVDQGWRLAWVPGMDARISGRRLCTTPVSYWKYTARTPRTFRMHGRRRQWFGSLVGIQFARLAQALAWPVLAFWDPRDRSFAISPRREEQRVLP